MLHMSKNWSAVALLSVIGALAIGCGEIAAADRDLVEYISVKLTRDELRDAKLAFRPKRSREICVSVDFLSKGYGEGDKSAKATECGFSVLRDGKIVANKKAGQDIYLFPEMRKEGEGDYLKKSSAWLTFTPTSPGEYTIRIDDKKGLFDLFKIQVIENK